MVQRRNAKTLARYNLGETLGSGSFGAVVRATDRISGAPRAWKALQKGKDNDSMFRKEAATMSVLDHPHLCRLFDVIEDQICFYFVMELCEGGDLQHYLEASSKNQLPEPSVAVLMRQLFGAIHYLHERSMAHSDFAARNILLLKRTADAPLEQCSAKLADFGSVRSFTAGAAVGPHKGDIWGLGLLMRGLICDISRVLGTKSPNRRPLDAQIWAGHSDEARCLCGRLLRRDPESRWTAEEAWHHDWFYVVELPRAEIPGGILQRLRRFVSANVLVRSSLQALAEQREGHEQLFADMDQNCDGLLCHNDLFICLTEVGEDVSKEDLQQLLQEADPDNIGVVELSCFKGIMLKEKHTDSKRCLQAAFRIMDRDMDGKISCADLLRIFPSMKRSEATAMVAEADMDGDGGINLEEFTAMLRQYFIKPVEATSTWPKPQPSKNESMVKAKIRALATRTFRTVEYDAESRYSCAMSSYSGVSHLSQLNDSDSDDDSAQTDEPPPSRPAQSRLPGAPMITAKVDKAELVRDSEALERAKRASIQLGLQPQVAQIVSL